VIGAHDEGVWPQVGPPMANRLDEADELTLICGQLGVVQADGAAEEGDRPAPLMQHGPEPGGVAVHHERRRKVQKLEYREAVSVAFRESNAAAMAGVQAKASRLSSCIKGSASHYRTVLMGISLCTWSLWAGWFFSASWTAFRAARTAAS
jgi:hypothetical protein